MKDITVEELKARLTEGEKIIVVDVREPYEYEEFNINGKLIPLGSLQERLSELEEVKNDEIVVHCKSGMRSASAKAYLASQGFTNVRNLIGGVLEWQRNFS